MPQHPNLYPLSTWSRLICGISFLPICQPCSPCCHALISTYRTKCSLPFIRPSRACGLSLGRPGQRLIEAPGDNRKVYGFGLLDWRDGWFDGRLAPGRTADVFCEQVRAAVARSKQRGRVAIVMADNLKTHTPAGSLLVRRLLSELKDQLYLVYTPAYDPDANRIEWLWRVSRRVVTHNHHRSDFALLLADVEKHFQALARTPAELLRHSGSPFAPDKDHEAPLSLAQAA